MIVRPAYKIRLVLILVILRCMILALESALVQGVVIEV